MAVSCDYVRGYLFSQQVGHEEHSANEYAGNVSEDRAEEDPVNHYHKEETRDGTKCKWYEKARKSRVRDRSGDNGHPARIGDAEIPGLGNGDYGHQSACDECQLWLKFEHQQPVGQRQRGK